MSSPRGAAQVDAPAESVPAPYRMLSVVVRGIDGTSPKAAVGLNAQVCDTVVQVEVVGQQQSTSQRSAGARGRHLLHDLCAVHGMWGGSQALRAAQLPSLLGELALRARATSVKASSALDGVARPRSVVSTA